MERSIIFVVVFVLLIGFISASPFATIGMQGLSMASSEAAEAISLIICASNPIVCLEGKIIGAVQGEAMGLLADANPEAYNAVVTYNQIQGYVDLGSEITEELQINEEGQIQEGTIQFSNEEESEIGNLVGEDFDQDDISVKGIEFTKEGNNSIFVFTEDESSINIKGHKFENIQAQSESKHPTYVEINNKGKILGADFTTNDKGDFYTINNDKIYVPPNSRLFFNGEKTEILVKEGGQLEKFPELIDSDLQGNIIEITGKNIKLPEEYVVLNEGKITYFDGKPFIKEGDTVLINDFVMKATDEDVELRFGGRSLFSWGEEKGNFVRIKRDEVIFNGKGVFEFNPGNYVERYDKFSNGYLRLMELPESNRPIQLGDRGKKIKLIQRLVGVKEDGVFGESTERALKIWQEENAIRIDGKFGQNSLEKALTSDSTRNIKLIPKNGKILVVRKEGKLNIDFNGDSIFGIGSKTFEINKGTKNEYLKDLSLSRANNERYFQRGDKGEDVKLIQKLVGVEEDGIFGRDTERAVKEWQKENKIMVDGRFGQQSYATSFRGEAVYKKIKKGILNNLEVPVELTLRDGKGEKISVLLEDLNGRFSYKGSKKNIVESFVTKTVLSFVDSSLNTLGFKQESPFASDFFTHYLAGRGDSLKVDIPGEWKDWIISEVGDKTGTFRLNPYDSEIFDLKNSLGYFDVEVLENEDGSKIFKLHDKYEFAFAKNDLSEKGRHGFSVGELDEETIKKLNEKFLPKRTFANPGGFEERFEIKTIGDKTYFFIPQEWLDENGYPYTIEGEFKIV